MFKWVHVSDLHFQNDDGFASKKMKSELIVTLKKIKNVNALIISGDLRYAKTNAMSVEEPVTYIKDLATSLGIDTEAVFCVPGNHDLTRSVKRSILVEGLTGDGKDNKGCYTLENGNFDKGILKDLLDDFTYFDNVEKELYGIDKGENHDIHRLIKLPDCNLILLNTSILAHCDSDRGNLLLGIGYIHELLNQLDTTKPTIMVGHHGHSFLEREEAKAIQSLLAQKGISIYLCGHEHDLFQESVWDNINQFTAGCIWVQGTTNIESAGFYVGEINDNIAKMSAYEWRKKEHVWSESPIDPKEVVASHILNGKSKKRIKAEISQVEESTIRLEKVLKENAPYSIDLSIDGYTLLGARGKEGIKYYWMKNGDRVESLAFNQRQNDPNPNLERRVQDENISAYTASTSFGCILSSSNSQCKFCETGTREFRGFLTAEEIAFQNIFMAIYDANCPSFPEVRNHAREFAFMGQGEPGFNYSAIRRAIQLTDLAMKAIGQNVYRYIISTSGVNDFIYQLIDDIKSNKYPNRVSLHFSLHACGELRKKLMPIEKTYNHQRFLELCKEYFSAYYEKYENAEKIGVGILTLKDFQPYIRDGEQPFDPITLNEAMLENILKTLDSDIFRIDLCEYNKAPSATKSTGVMSNEDVKKLIEFTERKGFEVKTFSSFGVGKDAGCGMLKSAYLDPSPAGETTLRKYEEAKKLLSYAVKKLDEGDV